jgi:hypothetical protein
MAKASKPKWIRRILAGCSACLGLKNTVADAIKMTAKVSSFIIIKTIPAKTKAEVSHNEFFHAGVSLIITMFSRNIKQQRQEIHS